MKLCSRPRAAGWWSMDQPGSESQCTHLPTSCMILNQSLHVSFEASVCLYVNTIMIITSSWTLVDLKRGYIYIKHLPPYTTYSSSLIHSNSCSQLKWRVWGKKKKKSSPSLQTLPVCLLALPTACLLRKGTPHEQRQRVIGPLPLCGPVCPEAHTTRCECLSFC